MIYYGGDVKVLLWIVCNCVLKYAIKESGMLNFGVTTNIYFSF